MMPASLCGRMAPHADIDGELPQPTPRESSPLLCLTGRPPFRSAFDRVAQIHLATNVIHTAAGTRST